MGFFRQDVFNTLAVRKLFAIVFLLSGLASYGQTLSFHPEGIRTYAVVVGISEYQDEGIRDLSYAHKDAKAFVNFLKSRAGGELGRRELKSLINEEATLARIQSALEWLVKKAGDGDQAIFYFAGHGDVETRNDEEKGYLLAYDTPFNNYRLNAIGLDYLNEHIIRELSKKNAKVVIITDACHSGALAGQGAGGRQATAAELMKRYASEVRIMSCQPYELAQEKRALGGGRGVFSYYLIQGLKGRANQGAKDVVDLYELEDFLQDKVRKETDKAQHPDIFGGLKKEALFQVDEATLEEMKSVEKEELERSLEEEVLTKLATKDGYNNYVGFDEALKKGRLLSPEGRSALDFYGRLYADTNFIPLRSFIDERFSIALMDSVQQAINAYLKTDPGELAQRAQYDDKYGRFPRYLEKAAEIFGPQDPRYRPTRAKQYYFEGLALRLEAEQAASQDSLYRLALEKQENALELESGAAYIHNELGILLPELGEQEKGIGHLQKAIEISPTWAIPYNNLAIEYKRQGDLEAAEAHYRKAIALKPDFSSAYANLGNLLVEEEQYSAADSMYRKGIELGPKYRDNYFNLGLLLSLYDGREAEADSMYRQALRLDPGYPEAYFELGNLYDYLGQADSAEAMYRRAIELRPEYAQAHLSLGVFYFSREQPEDAEEQFLSAIGIEPGFSEAHQNLGILYFVLGRLEEAEDQFLEVVRLDPENFPIYLNLGIVYGVQDQWEKIAVLLEGAPFTSDDKIEFLQQLGYNLLTQYEASGPALKAFQEAVALGPEAPSGYYWLCTCYTLLGQQEAALDALETTLEKARAANEDYYEKITTDEALEPLRENERYRALMSEFFPGR